MKKTIHSNKYRKRRKINRSERGGGIPSSIYINHSSVPPLDAAALFLYNTCYNPIYTETKASSVKFFSAFLPQYSSTLGRRPIMFFYVCVCQCHEHLPNQDKTVDICMLGVPPTHSPQHTEPQHKRKKKTIQLATSLIRLSSVRHARLNSPKRADCDSFSISFHCCCCCRAAWYSFDSLHLECWWISIVI